MRESEMNKNPIFIHSLFRTGSTYIWNKFRQQKNYHCYYEPFHQNLIFLNRDNPDLWEFTKQVTDQMNHPPLEKSYTYEYFDLIKDSEEGLKFFKKSLSFDEFCFNRKNQAAFKYINYLIENSGQKIPVFQFNRTSLRTKWFKSNFPESLNIYIYREPHSQWQSHLSMQRKNHLDIFCVMNLLTAGINAHSHCFKTLSLLVPLVEFHSDLFENERIIYSQLIKTYTPEEQYTIFYYTWLFALIFNWINSDLVISVDRLNVDNRYRQRISSFLKEWDVKPIDFSDIQIKKYSKFMLDKKTFDRIEEAVRSVIFESFTKKEVNDFFKSSGEEGDKLKKVLQKDSKSPKESKQIRVMQKDIISKYKEAFVAVSDYVLSQKDVEKKLKEELKQAVNQSQSYQQNLKDKGRALDEKNELLEKVNRQLKEKELQLASKKKQLGEVSQRVGEEQSSLINKEKQLARKEDQLRQKNVILKIKDKQLVELGEQLEHKDKQLAQKEEQVRQRNLILINKDQQLLDLEELLKQKNFVLAEQDLKLEEKENQLDKKAKECVDLKEELSQNEKLQNQNALLLKEREDRINQHEKHIQTILASKAYRLGQIMVQPLKFVKRVFAKLKAK
jgi:hypothetical protein